jgi:hypothetical protein
VASAVGAASSGTPLTLLLGACSFLTLRCSNGSCLAGGVEDVTGVATMVGQSLGLNAWIWAMSKRR